jgi:topoisomerase IV subunit A
VKRFLVEKSDKKVCFISESEGSLLELVTTDWIPRIKVNFRKEKDKERASEEINLADFIAVKGMKAQGNKLSVNTVNNVDLLEPIEPSVEFLKQHNSYIDFEQSIDAEGNPVTNSNGSPKQITMEF